MEYVIAKEFKTLIHRFKIGDAVTESHDLQPHTFDELKERGVIVAKAGEQSAAPEPDPVDATSRRIGRAIRAD